jgi:hypothetical protein
VRTWRDTRTGAKTKRCDAGLHDQRHRRDRSDTPEVTEGFKEGEFVTDGTSRKIGLRTFDNQAIISIVIS